MFPLQSWMLQQLPEVKRLFETHHQPVEPLDQLEKEAADFHIRVPFVGPFSAGKSTLINAVLDEKLLAVANSPETAIPCEIRYGTEESLTAQMEDGTIQSVTRERFKIREKGSEKRLYARLPNASLQHYPHLCLVDMPGWDSGIQSHSDAIDHYLGGSLAYLIVIPAHAGTIQSSIHALLAELRLHNMPVNLIINKCDGKTPEDRDQISRQIQRELAGILQEVPFQTVTVSARKREIEGLHAVLADLETQGERLFHQICGAAFRNELIRMQGYLSILRNKDNLKEEEIEARISDLETRMQTLREKQEQEKSELLAQIPPCRNTILSVVETDLKASLESLTTAAMHNGDMESVIGQIVRTATIKGMQDDLHPRLQRYIDKVEEMIPPELTASFQFQSHQTAEETTGEIKNVLKTTLAMLLATIKKGLHVIPVFDSLIDLFFGSADKRIAAARQREEARNQVIHKLIPGVLHRLRAPLQEALQQQVEAAAREIETAYAREEETMLSALRTLGTKRQKSQTAYAEEMARIASQQAVIDDMLSHLKVAPA